MRDETHVSMRKLVPELVAPALLEESQQSADQVLDPCVPVGPSLCLADLIDPDPTARLVACGDPVTQSADIGPPGPLVLLAVSDGQPAVVGALSLERGEQVDREVQPGAGLV